jgi:hypothetical protein
MRRCGWPTPTGTHWPCLPQLPMPVSSFMSLPIMEMRCIASGRCRSASRPSRRADLAVLDQVGLGAAEHELAGGDVDLAAAEVQTA